MKRFTSEAISLADQNSNTDPRIMAYDSIPEHIKLAFGLPPDMQGLDVDFEEVRNLDSMFKRQKREWSGQDVLDLHLNLAKS